MDAWLLKTLMRLWLGQETLEWYQYLDWEQAIHTWQQPHLVLPDYYKLQDFHGIPGGYLNPVAAITYDPVTTIASPPHEGWLRHQLLNWVKERPEQILDLGCGTGSSTLLLKGLVPQASVVGVDLSPYMLVVADQKAQQAGLAIHWQHGLAESTPWDDQSFHLVTASFLFHELPSTAAQAVLQESFRLLKPGGQILLLDGSQRLLRHLGWLIDLFREPYSRIYATGDIEDDLKAVGFADVRSQHLGLIHQIITGYRLTS
jgi:ubiquinone/menaquinone biosynthesis C-methylase UbiE